MKKLSISDVRNNLPSVIEGVSQTKETVVVTRYGKPVASSRLPGEFHRDPADRIIVAMSRRYGVDLVTSDKLILAYPPRPDCLVG